MPVQSYLKVLTLTLPFRWAMECLQTPTNAKVNAYGPLCLGLHDRDQCYSVRSSLGCSICRHMVVACLSRFVQNCMSPVLQTSCQPVAAARMLCLRHAAWYVSVTLACTFIYIERERERERERDSHVSVPLAHMYHKCRGTASMTLFLFAGFPEWSEVMTGWGNKMLAAVHTVAHMAAIGFGLPPHAFTERMLHGPHLLAPTGMSTTAFICPLA